MEELNFPDKTGVYLVDYEIQGLRDTKNIAQCLIVYCNCHGWHKVIVDPYGDNKKSSKYALDNMVSYKFVF